MKRERRKEGKKEGKKKLDLSANNKKLDAGGQSGMAPSCSLLLLFLQPVDEAGTSPTPNPPCFGGKERWRDSEEDSCCIVLLLLLQ